MAVFLVLTLLPVAALLEATVTLSGDAVTRQAESRVRDTASVGAALVQAQMKGLTDLVSSYSTRPSLVNALADPAHYDTGVIATNAANLHSSNAGNRVAFVADPGGRLIATVPPTPSIIGQDFSSLDWYRGVTASGRAYVSEAYRSAVVGTPVVVAVAAPVRGLDGSGPIRGIIVAGYDIGAVQGFVQGFADVQGISLTTTDQRGTLLATPGNRPTGLISERTDPSVAAALQGQTGILRTTDLTGEVLSGYAPVPDIGWTVRAEVSADLALASAASLRNDILVVGLAASLLVGGALGLLVVTLRRRSREEAALEAGRRQAAEADALFTLSLDMFAVAGFDGYFKRLNDAWTTTLGYPVEELMDRPFLEFVHPDDRELTEREAGRLAEGMVTAGFQNRYRHADGSYRTLDWSARARPEEQLIFAVAHDITDQKRAEEKLVEAQDRAMESARLKSEFLANMSHEIRTPMNGVIGMTELLMATPLSSEQAEYAETIRRSGDALLTVINDILDFSKIESGRLEMEAADVDVRTTVEDVAEIVAAAAQRRGLEIATVIDPVIPQWLIGDPGRLRQVLLNLAANAVKFTETGEVVIRARVEGDSQQLVRMRFEVVDTGIGIPEEVQPRLFTAFTQADASTTRKYGGTGLGLAISSQLVALMGGEIGVHSSPGVGSTFWFTVPLGRSSRARTGPEAAATLRDVRVLVVDDNSTNRTLLERTLRGWGARPEVASGGEEGLRLLHAQPATDPYRLVILDQLMPGMDGHEVAARIRRERSVAPPRLVLLTSVSERPHPGRRAAAFDARLTKPVRRAALHDCLVSVLSRDGVTARPAAATPHQNGSAAAAPATDLRVLIAEDNPVNQMVARRLLENMGHRVDVVANGAEAVAAVAHTDYAVVLMDCQMPIMDGFEATAAIHRLIEGRRRPPIVAMTASAMEGDEERCLAAGMDAYISKPVTSAQLAVALQRWLTVEAASTAPADNGAGAVLDTAAINALHELSLASDPMMLGNLVSLYNSDMARRLGELAEAARTADMVALARLAHDMKGSSAVLGAVDVADACARLEVAVREGRPEGVGALVARIEVEYERARAALEREVAAPPAR